MMNLLQSPVIMILSSLNHPNVVLIWNSLYSEVLLIHQKKHPCQNPWLLFGGDVFGRDHCRNLPFDLGPSRNSLKSYRTVVIRQCVSYKLLLMSINKPMHDSLQDDCCILNASYVALQFFCCQLSRFCPSACLLERFSLIITIYYNYYDYYNLAPLALVIQVGDDYDLTLIFLSKRSCPPFSLCLFFNRPVQISENAVNFPGFESNY